MRGRPQGKVTPLREAVAAEVTARRIAGRPIIRAAIARKIGLHGVSDVSRIMRDCERMGLI